MINKFFIFVFLTYTSLVASNLAPFIEKCKADDDKCHKESTQKVIPLFADGIPELNVDKLDPLFLKRVDTSTSNLNLTVTDIKATGLKNCEAKKVRRDSSKLTIDITLQCGVELLGKYDMKGQLFLLPIQGNGDLTAKVPKAEINVVVNHVEKTKKDGLKHWSVKSWSHTFELKEPSQVKFGNLFPDNEVLRKPIEELIASNGNDVITQIGYGIIKAIVGVVIDNVKHMFDKVPITDLSLD